MRFSISILYLSKWFFVLFSFQVIFWNYYFVKLNWIFRTCFHCTRAHEKELQWNLSRTKKKKTHTTYETKLKPVCLESKKWFGTDYGMFKAHRDIFWLWCSCCCSFFFNFCLVTYNINSYSRLTLIKKQINTEAEWELRMKKKELRV